MPSSCTRYLRDVRSGEFEAPEFDTMEMWINCNYAIKPVADEFTENFRRKSLAVVKDFVSPQIREVRNHQSYFSRAGASQSVGNKQSLQDFQVRVVQTPHYDRIRTCPPLSDAGKSLSVRELMDRNSAKWEAQE